MSIYIIFSFQQEKIKKNPQYEWIEAYLNIVDWHEKKDK